LRRGHSTHHSTLSITCQRRSQSRTYSGLDDVGSRSAYEYVHRAKCQQMGPLSPLHVMKL
jgi:hypothetical protein